MDLVEIRPLHSVHKYLYACSTNVEFPSVYSGSHTPRWKRKMAFANRKVMFWSGGASRDRTDDLIVANDNALRIRHRDFNSLEVDYVPLRSENPNCGSQMIRQIRLPEAKPTQYMSKSALQMVLAPTQVMIYGYLGTRSFGGKDTPQRLSCSRRSLIAQTRGRSGST